MEMPLRVGPLLVALLLLTVGCVLFVYLENPSSALVLITISGVVFGINLHEVEPPQKVIPLWVLIAVPVGFAVLLFGAIVFNVSHPSGAVSDHWVMPVQYRFVLAVFLWSSYLAIAYRRFRRAVAQARKAGVVRT